MLQRILTNGQLQESVWIKNFVAAFVETFVELPHYFDKGCAKDQDLDFRTDFN